MNPCSPARSRRRKILLVDNHRFLTPERMSGLCQTFRICLRADVKMGGLRRSGRQITLVGQPVSLKKSARRLDRDGRSHAAVFHSAGSDEDPKWVVDMIDLLTPPSSDGIF